jgi:siroheme synthase-like protein
MQIEPSQATYALVLTNLSRVRCVVVGGGGVAERKVGELLAGGACPELISPMLTDGLEAWRQAGKLTHQRRSYRPGDLQGAFLVLAATNDAQVNAAIAAEGARLGILVNIADSPAAGNFHTAATVRRGELLLAVSTGGSSPTLAARIRRELEARYGGEYGILLALLRELRAGPARLLDPGRRALLWRRLVCDTMLHWLSTGDTGRAAAYAHEQIELLSRPDR